MRTKIIKCISYCCLLGIIIIAWVFYANILRPALAQPQPTKPPMKFLVAG